MSGRLQSIEEVRAEILGRVTALDPEEVSLDDALGRTLAAHVTARDPIPPFDNTAMDGFALRSADTADASPEQPMTLRVTGTVEAGANVLPTVESKQAVRIYTGAPIPPGSDCVVPWEKAVRFDEDSVVLDEPVRSGVHIRRRGTDLGRDAVAIEAGTRLTPAALGLLAMVGCPAVSVGPRVRVAVHSSGDELIPIEHALSPGKIRNSNLTSLCARLHQWGAIAVPRPVLRDTPDAVRTGLRETLSSKPHAIVTTGGVSAGDLDFVREVARELGDDVQIRKVNMKPGKPLVDGLIDGVPFFGLPGNPAACLVSFEMFVRPALAKLEGRSDALPPRRVARLAHAFGAQEIDRPQFLRGTVDFDHERREYRVQLPTAQGSHHMSSFARANCLVEIDVQSGPLEEGAELTVHLLDH